MTVRHDTPTGNCVKRHGCTRPECLARARRYAKHSSIMSRLGTRRSLDAEAVSTKVRADLEATDYSLSQLARAYGVSLCTVSALAQDPPRRARTQRRVSEKVFAWSPYAVPSVEPNGQVLAVGTTRRIRSLTRDGHNAEEIVRHLARHGADVRPAWVHQAAQGLKVTSKVRHDATEAAFEELVTTPGPSAHARGFGRRMGWPRPMAWDPRDLDDPEAKPPADNEIRECRICHRPMATRHEVKAGLPGLTWAQRERIRRRGGVVVHKGDEVCRRCGYDPEERRKRLEKENAK